MLLSTKISSNKEIHKQMLGKTVLLSTKHKEKNDLLSTNLANNNMLLQNNLRNNKLLQTNLRNNTGLLSTKSK